MTAITAPSAATPEQVAASPKISLHDHLDGALRPATLIELAGPAGHALPSEDPAELAAIFRANADSGSLVRYLEAFDHTTAVMQTAENLTRIAREFVLDEAADGVVYAEARWAPERHLAQGLSLDAAVDAVTAGLREGMDEAAASGRPVLVTQLVTAMRQDDHGREIAELAVRRRLAVGRAGVPTAESLGGAVVGFDIAGPELGFRPSRLAAAFELLAGELVPVTVHAGEADGVDSVREALVVGRALRIGHGIRVLEDVEGWADPEAEPVFGPVASWVRDRGIPLEVCPTSNLQTGAVTALLGDDAPEHGALTVADHPFDALYRLGFAVTVSPDDRLVSGVTLTGDLQDLTAAFGYGLDDLELFQLTAADAAFLPAAVREDLADLVVEGFAALR